MKGTLDSIVPDDSSNLILRKGDKMNTRKRPLLLGATLIVALGAFAGTQALSAGAERAAVPPDQGMAAVGASISSQPTALAIVSPSVSHTNADYQTGGTGLRNQRDGAMTINGVSGPVVAAYLWWAFITIGPAGTAQSRISIKRKEAASFRLIHGAMVGSGGSPCWPGTTLTVFRASVPLTVATGNGEYEVRLQAGSAGSFAGEDPWLAPAPPLAEGATLALIYSNPGRTTDVFDTGLAGTLFLGTPGITYTLALSAPSAGALTKWDTIGADGQTGTSRLADLGTANEATTINTVPVSGPGSAYNDSNWNGSDSRPLPQLWDTHGHDITTATPPGTATLDVAIASPGGSAFTDCLNLVANLVSTS